MRVGRRAFGGRAIGPGGHPEPPSGDRDRCSARDIGQGRRDGTGAGLARHSLRAPGIVLSGPHVDNTNTADFRWILKNFLGSWPEVRPLPPLVAGHGRLQPAPAGLIFVASGRTGHCGNSALSILGLAGRQRSSPGRAAGRFVRNQGRHRHRQQKTARRTVGSPTGPISRNASPPSTTDAHD